VSSLPPFQQRGRGRVLLAALAGLVVAGVVIGLVVAWLSTRVLDAAGLDDPYPTIPPGRTADLPSQPPEGTAPETSERTPDVQTPATTAGPREPTLTASPRQVGADEPITLTGRFPGLAAGTALEIERRIGGSAWELFPVTLTSGANGSFSVVVQTGQVGENEFRLSVPGTSRVSPSAPVTVG
jgi:hypothetical protein